MYSFQPVAMPVSTFYTAADYLVAMNNNPQTLPQDFELISVGATPYHVKWQFPPMTKYDAHGKRRIWQIGFDGYQTWTLSGTAETTRIECRPVETNSSNRSLTEQALQFATYRNKCKMLKGGYIPEGSNQIPKLLPMKGTLLKNTTIQRWPLYIDRKLDGVHGLGYWSGGDLKFLSNSNESYNHLKHLCTQLKEFAYYLPNECMIDGEIYVHGLTLAEINGAVATRVNYNPVAETLNYYIHDLDWFNNSILEDRMELLERSYAGYTAALTAPTNIYVNPKYLVNNEDECAAAVESFIEAKFEGGMLRYPGRGEMTEKQRDFSRYKQGRCTRLIKMKKFEDSEGAVTGVIAGKGHDQYLAKLQVLDAVSNYTLTIRWGNETERAQWLQYPQMVVGRILKFKYAHRHAKSNIPVQATGVGWRDVYR
jgi:hypothetical protein